jgi:hypothetical protein
VQVPAVDTMVVSVDDLRSDERYRRAQDDWLAAEEEPATSRAVRLPRRREGHGSRNLLWFGAGVLFLIAVAALIVWGLSRAHFVGAAKDGRVAVYQGVPWNLVRKLFDHDLRSRSDALGLVHRLERDVVS